MNTMNSLVGKPATSANVRGTGSTNNGANLDLLEIVFRRKSLLVASFALGLLGSLAYYLLSIPLFKSGSRLLLMPSNAGAMATHADSQSEAVSQDLLATHMI